MRFGIFFLVTLFFVSSCDWIEGKVNPTWMGTYYPHGNPLNGISEFGFNSLESCRYWAESKMVDSSDDYECGKNCKPDGHGLYICEETTD